MASLEALEALLAWRQDTVRAVTPTALAESLSVENMGHEVPPRLYASLVSFRHLRQDNRVRICERFMDGD